jgi:biotin carboxyl carrier protein
VRRYTVEVGGRTHTIDVEEITAEKFHVRVGGHDFDLTLSLQAEEVASSYRPPPIEGLPPVPATAPPPLPPAPDRVLAASAEVRAPMPGTVLSVEVAPGAVVKRGDTLVRLEAMKMINQVRAHRDGVVAEVKAAPGQAAAFGDVLVTLVQDES